MKHGNGSGGNGASSYGRPVTWLFWARVAAVPVWTAGSLTFCRLLLWLLFIFLLQSVEQLVKRRLQRLCCLCAVKLPFKTFSLQFLLSLHHTIPTKSVLYFQYITLFWRAGLLTNLINDVVKLLLHLILYFFNLIWGHRDVRHLILELLQRLS